jgi:hypothetical protein
VIDSDKLAMYLDRIVASAEPLRGMVDDIHLVRRCRIG